MEKVVHDCHLYIPNLAETWGWRDWACLVSVWTLTCNTSEDIKINISFFLWLVTADKKEKIDPAYVVNLLYFFALSVDKIKSKTYDIQSNSGMQRINPVCFLLN